MITCKVIETLDEFASLRQPWNELLYGNEVEHVFMKHEWFVEWIKAHEEHRRLAVVTLWSDGQLMAAAPLRRTKLNFRGVKARGLAFLSSSISPRCNFIAADQAHLAALATQVFGLKGWDVLVTENQEEALGVTQQYLGLLKSSDGKYRYQVEAARQSPFMLLEGMFDAYWNSLPKKRRADIEKYSLKRLEKAESHEFFRVTDPKEFDQIFPVMLEISRKSWKFKTDGHLKADSPEGKLFQGFTPYALERGWVSLYILKINGGYAGFDYILSHGGFHTGSRTDYDEEYKYYSPGNTIKILEIKDFMCQNSNSIFDWGGDPDKYKMEWCSYLRGHVTVTVGNNNLRGNAILFSKSSLLPSLRRFAGAFKKAKKP